MSSPIENGSASPCDNLAMGRANFAFRMEVWGRLQTQEDDSWDKLASRLDATPWYRLRSRYRLLPNQLRHRHPTKRPPAPHPLPSPNHNRRSSAEADHGHEHKWRGACREAQTRGHSCGRDCRLPGLEGLDQSWRVVSEQQ